MANPDRIEATARVTGGTRYTASDVASNLYKQYSNTTIVPSAELSALSTASQVNGAIAATYGDRHACIGLKSEITQNPNDPNLGYYEYNFRGDEPSFSIIC